MRAIHLATLCLTASLCLSACDPKPTAAPPTADPPAIETTGAATSPKKTVKQAPAEGKRPKPRKPHYVPCDPKHPELPCTPDSWPEKEAEARPGVKPHHVPCDPKHPELPCTPDAKLPAPTP